MQKRYEYPQKMRSLQKGTLTQSSAKPLPVFPITRSENSRADNVSVPLVPYEATGNSPTPVESSSFRNPPLSITTHSQENPLVHTCTCTHTHAHPSPLPHSIGLEGKWEGSLGVQMEGTATPSQGNNHSLFCYSHCNTKTYARRTTHSLTNSPSKLLSHDCLTVFQPFQAY